ncbi:hypothetical protein RND71_002783 [Anisodus tanguticus]|uniref:Mediator of RNA polymerase II transcription subunit 25 n=1 Tax=Anisodus tanguticus TaxID=243964 RepID=A0AAE1SWN5_9SOLA|nr:hypothetical protein RND71_002783 [Anisodus tanguticus]
MLQRSGWTRDIDMFFQWLSAIHFSGGGFDDAAVTQGLAAALMMYSSLDGSETQENADGRRHCLLVAASNPHPLPVYCHAMQKLELSGNTEAHVSSCLADAETIAHAFPQCFVSLSVICPRKLPKLRAIYNAGKRDPQAADPPVDTSENPNFLVLISENFSEACAVLSHTEMTSLTPNQSLVEMSISSVPPVSGPAVTSNPAVMNQQQISAGNIPTATVNIENTVTSVTGPAPPHQRIASLESASSTSVSEEMVPNNENFKEKTPVVSVMTEFLRPFSGAAGNVRILNGVASAIPDAFAGTGEIAPFAGTGQIAQNSVPASLTSMVASMSGISDLCMSQLLSNTQGGIGAGRQTAPVMSQGNLPASQMVQSGIGMHQNVPSGIGTGTPSVIGTMMPTPGMTQQGQPGMLPLGRNNSTEANTSLSQQQTSAIFPSAQSSYAKFWEVRPANK